jgi:hypothetical protein
MGIPGEVADARASVLNSTGHLLAMQDDGGPQTCSVLMPTAKGPCQFGQGTFAGASGNGKDAPKPAVYRAGGGMRPRDLHAPG